MLVLVLMQYLVVWKLTPFFSLHKSFNFFFFFVSSFTHYPSPSRHSSSEVTCFPYFDDPFLVSSLSLSLSRVLFLFVGTELNNFWLSSCTSFSWFQSEWISVVSQTWMLCFSWCLLAWNKMILGVGCFHSIWNVQYSIDLTNEFCGLYEFVMLSNMERKLYEFLQCLLFRRNLAFKFLYLALICFKFCNELVHICWLYLYLNLPLPILN